MQIFFFADNCPQKALLAPRTLMQSHWGQTQWGGNSPLFSETSASPENKKSWGRYQLPPTPQSVLSPPGPWRVSVILRELWPSPARTSGSCSAGCGARCCVPGAAATTPGSQGPAPPASWGGPTFIWNSHSGYSESGFRTTSWPPL